VNAQQLGETSLMFLVHPTLTEDSLTKTVNAIQQVIQMMNAIKN
jgi:dTDP-4-amino-4,6-dideoxygalactose transaminase